MEEPEYSGNFPTLSAWRAFAGDVITEACMFDLQKISLKFTPTAGDVHNKQQCTQNITILEGTLYSVFLDKQIFLIVKEHIEHLNVHIVWQLIQVFTANPTISFFSTQLK